MPDSASGSTPAGKKMFVVQTRAFGRSKRVTLGEHGAPDFSRRRGSPQGGRGGHSPNQEGAAGPVPPEPALVPTVADLAERYQREYVEMHCKPLTVSHYKLMLRKHIVPGPRRAAGYGCRIQGHPRVSTTGCITCPPWRTAPSTSWSRCSIPGRRMGMASLRNQPLPAGVPRFKVEKHERFLTREEIAPPRCGAGGWHRAERSGLRPTQRPRSTYSC